MASTWCTDARWQHAGMTGWQVGSRHFPPSTRFWIPDNSIRNDDGAPGRLIFESA
jgi:hypothetical protein